MKYSIIRNGEGFGAIYQSYMSGIAYCKYKGYEYIHKKIKIVEHGENVEELNKFIGIPHNNLTPDKIENFSEEINWTNNPDNYYTKDVLDIIKKYYYSTPKPRISPFEIAIHIRRGDVSYHRNNSGSFKRYTDNTFYKKVIKILKTEYPNYRICIYSQGKLEDFEELSGDNIYFCLNKSLTLTFHQLVKAKVLVTAKSSLSYCAALLSENEVYYIPFWHKPLKKWKII